MSLLIEKKLMKSKKHLQKKKKKVNTFNNLQNLQWSLPRFLKKKIYIELEEK